ncbi:MAG: hypothetical protein R8G66_29630 [Cytophagales bacterium]|nr:hypothetical protein [Cytophagales bacterium]
MNFFFSFADKTSYTLLFTGSVIFLFFSSILNLYYPTDLFLLKYFLLVGIFDTIMICAKQYSDLLKNGFQNFVGDPVLSAERRKLKEAVYSKKNIWIGITIATFFVIISIILEFVTIDALGITSLTALFVSILLSIIGYMLFAHLLHFLVRLSSSDIEKYSRFYPAYTNWLVDITKNSAFYQNAFFIAGTMYVTLFTIHAPDDTLKILKTATFGNSSDLILTISWVIIILAVVVGFPVISYIRSRAIRNIVMNLKTKSSQYYENALKELKVEKQIEYIKIVKEIIESANYPVNTKINVAVSTATVFINLLIAVLKIFPNVWKLSGN